MPESSLSFSSAVSACGSRLQLQSTSEGVKKSRSAKGRADCDARATVGTRGLAARQVECAGTRFRNLTNDPGMSMKTKHNDKKSIPRSGKELGAEPGVGRNPQVAVVPPRVSATRRVSKHRCQTLTTVTGESGSSSGFCSQTLGENWLGGGRAALRGGSRSASFGERTLNQQEVTQ